MSSTRRNPAFRAAALLAKLPLIRMTMACVAVLTIPAASIAANLIINGSFETPVVPVGGFSDFLGGSSSITGWKVVGVDSSVVNKTFMQNGIVFQAQDGNQWLDLSGVTSNSNTSGVTQDVATTIGVVYTLSFFVGSATDGSLFFPATVDLSINGGPRVHYTNPTAPSTMLNWKPFTLEFTATSSTTNLAFLNGSAANNFLAALDNVSLVPDTDRDGIPDSSDNCPYTPNGPLLGTCLGNFPQGQAACHANTDCTSAMCSLNQEDTGGIGTGSPPDGIGDACQCGDVDNSGIVDNNDATLAARAALHITPFTAGVTALPGFLKCDVNNDGLCNNNDATVIRRAALGLAPAIQQKCTAAVPH